MSKLFFLAALAVIAIAGVSADECHGKDVGTAGEFDFYVFAQSWSATFCEAKKSFPGCINPTKWQRSNLTIHGMWPNYNSKQGGSWWPQCCDSSYGTSLNGTVIKELFAELQAYWPCEQDPTAKNLQDTIWAHEWGKHGTCSGLDQETYFRQGIAIAAQIGTPAEISSNVGGSVSANDLFNYFGASGCSSGSDCMVGFQCDRSNNLEGITTCWSKGANPKAVKCPAETVGKWTCSGDSINIKSF